MDMATPRNSLMLTVAQVVLAGAVTVALLELARFFGGRAGLWIVGVVLLFLATLCLFRLRK